MSTSWHEDADKTQDWLDSHARPWDLETALCVLLLVGSLLIGGWLFLDNLGLL